ncbi:hypothetical protein [Absidia glauca]|uniref:Transmembrane protein UsgS n=1 Tax=Absidia glauca TaxID=4829 RepID=A0A168PX88_ABSGL|nr:hypothetical protein [Absidia glauca]
MASWMVNGLQLGIQDALMGIKMVAKNPRLRQQKFLYIFLILTLLSLVLLGVTHLLVTLPLRFAKYILQHYPTATDTSQVDNLLVSAHRIIRDVFSYVPVVALMFMRYVYPKPLDDLFMETLRYIDQVNGGVYSYSGAMATRSYRKEYWPNMKSYIFRTWKKVCLGLMILLLSFLPTVGPFVIPLAGAYTAWRSLGGDIQAIVAVGIGFLILPRWTTFRLVRVLLGMRTLMRELLEPYFVRMGMSHSEKKRWFKGRSNVLFGFSVIAYLLIRIPYLGFVGYGVAQAAAAYMLTTMVTADEINRSSSKLNVESLKVAAKD